MKIEKLSHLFNTNAPESLSVKEKRMVFGEAPLPTPDTKVTATENVEKQDPTAEIKDEKEKIEDKTNTDLNKEAGATANEIQKPQNIKELKEVTMSGLKKTVSLQNAELVPNKETADSFTINCFKFKGGEVFPPFILKIDSSKNIIFEYPKSKYGGEGDTIKVENFSEQEIANLLESTWKKITHVEAKNDLNQTAFAIDRPDDLGKKRKIDESLRRTDVRRRNEINNSFDELWDKIEKHKEIEQILKNPPFNCKDEKECISYLRKLVESHTDEGNDDTDVETKFYNTEFDDIIENTDILKTLKLTEEYGKSITGDSSFMSYRSWLFEELNKAKDIDTQTKFTNEIFRTSLIANQSNKLLDTISEMKVDLENKDTYSTTNETVAKEEFSLKSEAQKAGFASVGKVAGATGAAEIFVNPKGKLFDSEGKELKSNEAAKIKVSEKYKEAVKTATQNEKERTALEDNQLTIVDKLKNELDKTRLKSPKISSELEGTRLKINISDEASESPEFWSKFAKFYVEKGSEKDQYKMSFLPYSMTKSTILSFENQDQMYKEFKNIVSTEIIHQKRVQKYVESTKSETNKTTYEFEKNLGDDYKLSQSIKDHFVGTKGADSDRYSEESKHLDNLPILVNGLNEGFNIPAENAPGIIIGILQPYSNKIFNAQDVLNAIMGKVEGEKFQAEYKRLTNEVNEKRGGEEAKTKLNEMQKKYNATIEICKALERSEYREDKDMGNADRYGKYLDKTEISTEDTQIVAEYDLDSVSAFNKSTPKVPEDNKYSIGISSKAWEKFKNSYGEYLEKQKDPENVKGLENKEYYALRAALRSQDIKVLVQNGYLKQEPGGQKMVLVAMPPLNDKVLSRIDKDYAIDDFDSEIEKNAHAGKNYETYNNEMSARAEMMTDNADRDTIRAKLKAELIKLFRENMDKNDSWWLIRFMSGTKSAESRKVGNMGDPEKKFSYTPEFNNTVDAIVDKIVSDKEVAVEGKKMKIVDENGNMNMENLRKYLEDLGKKGATTLKIREMQRDRAMLKDTTDVVINGTDLNLNLDNKELKEFLTATAFSKDLWEKVKGRERLIGTFSKGPIVLNDEEIGQFVHKALSEENTVNITDVYDYLKSAGKIPDGIKDLSIKELCNKYQEIEEKKNPDEAEKYIQKYVEQLAYITIRTSRLGTSEPKFEGVPEDVTKMSPEALMAIVAGSEFSDKEENAEQEAVLGKMLDKMNLKPGMREIVKQYKNEYGPEKTVQLLEKIKDSKISEDIEKAYAKAYANVSADAEELNKEEEFKKLAKEIGEEKDEEKKAMKVENLTKNLGNFYAAISREGKLGGGGASFNIPLTDGVSLVVGLGADKNGSFYPALGLSYTDKETNISSGIGTSLGVNPKTGDVMPMLGINTNIPIKVSSGYDITISPSIGGALIPKDGNFIPGGAASLMLGLQERDDRKIEEMYAEMTKLADEVEAENDPAKKAEAIKKLFKTPKFMQTLPLHNEAEVDALSPESAKAMYDEIKSECQKIAEDKGKKGGTDNSRWLEYFKPENIAIGAGAGISKEGWGIGPMLNFSFSLGKAIVLNYKTADGQIKTEMATDATIDDLVKKVIKEAEDAGKGQECDYIMRAGKLMLLSKSDENEIPDDAIYIDTKTGKEYLKDDGTNENLKKVRQIRVTALDHNRDTEVYVDPNIDPPIKVGIKTDGTILIPGDSKGLIVARKIYQYPARTTLTGSTSKEILIITDNPERLKGNTIMAESKTKAEMDTNGENRKTELEVRKGEAFEIRDDGYFAKLSDASEMQTWLGELKETKNYGAQTETEDASRKESLGRIEKVNTVKPEDLEKENKENTPWTPETAKLLWPEKTDKAGKEDGGAMGEALRSGAVNISDSEQVLQKANEILTAAGKNPLSPAAEMQLYMYINYKYYVNVWKGDRGTIEKNFEHNQNALKGVFKEKFTKAIESLIKKGKLKLPDGVSGNEAYAEKLVKIIFGKSKENFTKKLDEISQNGTLKGEAFKNAFNKAQFTSPQDMIMYVGTTHGRRSAGAEGKPTLSRIVTGENSKMEGENFMAMLDEGTDWTDASKTAGIDETTRENMAKIILEVSSPSPEVNDFETFMSPLAYRLAVFSEATSAEIGAANYENLSKFYEKKGVDATDAEKKAAEEFVKFVDKVEKAILANQKELPLKNGYVITNLDPKLISGNFAKCTNTTVGLSNLDMKLSTPTKVIVSKVSSVNYKEQKGLASTNLGFTVVGYQELEEKEEKPKDKKKPPEDDKPPEDENPPHEGKDPDKGGPGATGTTAADANHDNAGNVGIGGATATSVDVNGNPIGTSPTAQVTGALGQTTDTPGKPH